MAGSEIKEILLKAVLDTSDVEAGMKRVQTALEGVGTASSKATSAPTGQSGPAALTQQLQQTTQSATTASTAMQTFSAATAKAFGQNVTGPASQLNQQVQQISQSANIAATALGVAFGAVLAKAVSAIASEMAAIPRQLADIVEQGASVQHATDAFANLSAGIGVLSSQYLPALRNASHGFISDLDLMHAGSKALLEGLSPNQFVQITSSVTTLSKALGVDTVGAIDKVERAIAAGSAKGLTGLGLSKAQLDELDASLEKIATPAGKLQAILETLATAQKTLGETSFGAGDALAQVEIAFTNLYNKVATYLDNDPALRHSFTELRDTINSIDTKSLAEFIANIATTAVNATTELTKFTNELYKLSKYADALPGARYVTIASRIGSGLGTAIDYLSGSSNAANIDFGSFGGPQNNFDNHSSLGTGKPPKPGKSPADTLALKLQSLLASADTESDQVGLHQAFQSGDLESVDLFTNKIHEDIREKVQAGLGEAFVKFKEKNPEAADSILDTATATTIATNYNKAMVPAIDQITKYQQEKISQSLENGVSDAFESGNINVANQLQQQLENADFNQTLNAQLEKLSTTGITVGSQKYTDAVKASMDEAQAHMDLQNQAYAHKLEQYNKTAFQNAFSVFSDLYSAAAQGGAKGVQQYLTQALTNVAIGFAAQITTSIATSTLGLNLGSISSASGLGQALGSAVGFKGGTAGDLGSLFSGPAGLTASATALDESAAALTAAATALGGAAASNGVSSIAGSVTSSGGVSGVLGNITSSIGTTNAPALGTTASFGFPQIAAAAVAAVTAYESVKGVQSVASGGNLTFGQQAALALPTFGASFAYNPIKNLLGFGGGPSQASLDAQNRNSFLDQFIKDHGNASDQLSNTFSFNTVGGTSTLNPNNFGASTGSPKNNLATQLAQPLAELATGGNGKLTDDITGIFSHGINDAKNYNEELINTQSLLNKMGTNAKGAESNLLQLFKDGKISQNQFADGLQQLETLSKGVFTGKDGIAQGFKIIAESLSSGTGGGATTAVQALGTEIRTLALAGTTSTKSLIDSFTKAGDSVHADFFQQLLDGGTQVSATTDTIAADYTKAGDTVKAKFFALLSSQGFKTADDISKALDDPNLFNQLLTDLQNAGDFSIGLADSADQTTAAVTNLGTSGAGTMQTLVGKTGDQTTALKNQYDAVKKLQQAYLDLGAAQSGAPSTGGTGGAGGTSDPTGRTKRRGLNRVSP